MKDLCFFGAKRERESVLSREEVSVCVCEEGCNRFKSGGGEQAYV